MKYYNRLLSALVFALCLFAPVLAFGQVITANGVIAKDNSSTLRLNLPVTGADATLHTLSLNLDGTAVLSAAATGNGAGGIGAITTTLSGGWTGATTFAAGTSITSPLFTGTGATTYDAGGAAAIVVGSADVTGITLTTDGGSVVVDGSLNGVAPAGIVANPAAGTWTLTKDAAGICVLTAADDDATAALTLVPGGAAACVLGGASTTTITLTTDGTGTGELVLPAQSVEATEMANDTITFDQISDTLTPEAGTSIVGADTIGGDPQLPASAIGFGTTGIIFEGATGGAGDAFEGLLTAADITVADKTWTLPNVTGTVVTTGDTGSVTATMIADITRSVNIPITGAITDTGGDALIDATAAADTVPDYGVSGSNLVLVWDDTGGSIDTGNAYFQFVIPADYVSGGTFVCTVSQDGATGANIESLDLEITNQVVGAAQDSSLTANAAVNLTDTTNIQEVSFDRSAGSGAALAAGQAVTVRIEQQNVAADDSVLLYGLRFEYTASQ